MENNAHNRLSSYVKPRIIEDKRKDWIGYGEDNNYYQHLIDLFVNSTTNRSIIEGISKLIFGRGLDAIDSSTKPDQYASMKSIFSDSCLRKVALDTKLLGEGSFQVLYKKGKVVKAEHFPRQTLRPEKMNDDGEIEAYYYSPNWKDVKPSDKPKGLQTLDLVTVTNRKLKLSEDMCPGLIMYVRKIMKLLTLN